MHFSNIAFLWGLLAVPLPILLHLFFRRRKSKVPFSTIQFFHQRRRYLAHRRRLRELLLLLIRTLILLFLVMALSRLLFQSAPYTMSARSDAVIVLDDTLSMDRRISSGSTAFELGVEKAEEILDTLSEGDSVALVFLSGKEGTALTRKRQLVRQLLQDAEVTGASGSYSAALKQAAAYLAAAGNPNKEIYVTSDFQANQVPATPVDLDLPRGSRVYFLPVPGTPENLSVEEVVLSSRPKIINRQVTIPYAVHNHGANDRETEVSLSIDSEVIRTDSITVQAGTVFKGTFQYVPDRPGFLSGSVAITDRCLAMDNRRYFTVDVTESIRTLLLESDVFSRIRPFHFLGPAINPSPGEALNGIDTEQGFAQEIVSSRLRTYHVVLMANPQPLTGPAAAALMQYMENGGAVVVFAGSQVNSETFAAFQDDRIRNLFKNRQPADFSGLTLRGPLGQLDKLLRMDMLKWRRIHELSPSSSANILATAHGHPMIAQETIGAGNFIACAFSVRRDYCNWPELKSFPVVMIHLLTYAAHDPQQNAAIDCGRRLRLLTDKKQIELSYHGGAAHRLPAEKGEAFFKDTWVPGLLRINNARPGSVAVNPAPEESVLQTVTAGKIRTIVKGRASILKTEARLDSQIRNYRQGSELTGLFFFFVMMLMLAEILVGNNYVLSGRTRITSRKGVVS
jgi:hypothetical protein